jgi:hypothetical protein
MVRFHQCQLSGSLALYFLFLWLSWLFAVWMTEPKPTKQFYVRFCFPDAAIADAFLERFGGMRFTYSPSKSGQRPSGPRLRYQRSYSPRIVGGKVMTPADLRRLHKYMLDIVTVISDEMRAVIEREWPELTHKLPPTKPQG